MHFKDFSQVIGGKGVKRFIDHVASLKSISYLIVSHPRSKTEKLTAYKGQCNVYFMTWPVQNVTGLLLFLSLYGTGSTLSLKQI